MSAIASLPQVRSLLKCTIEGFFILGLVTWTIA
jgi:hypothetical protein